MPLPGTELIRRFLLHVLPPRFVRVRSYGALAGGVRTKYLARCRALLGVPEPVAAEVAASHATAAPPASPSPMVPATPGLSPASPCGAVPHGTTTDSATATQAAAEPRRCPVCSRGMLQEVASCARPRRSELAGWLFTQHWHDVSPQVAVGVRIPWPHKGWDSS